MSNLRCAASNVKKGRAFKPFHKGGDDPKGNPFAQHGKGKSSVRDAFRNAKSFPFQRGGKR